MKNLHSPRSECRTVTIPAPVGGATSGAVYIAGALRGVWLADAAAGEAATLVVEGEVWLPKASALALTLGAAVAWDGADSDIVAQGAGVRLGVVLEGFGAGSTLTRVMLTPDA